MRIMTTRWVFSRRQKAFCRKRARTWVGVRWVWRASVCGGPGCECARVLWWEMTRKGARVSVTGWRRPIGCLKLQIIFCKLQIIFCKRATKYRALVRKMTCKDKTCCGCLPACNRMSLIWRTNERVSIMTTIAYYISYARALCRHNAHDTYIPQASEYGVAMISRLLQIIGLFCTRDL